MLTPDELATPERPSAFGPDVMALRPDHTPGGTFDRAAAADRVRQRGEAPVKPVLLDQNVVAGIGNIFASEGLFLARAARPRA